MKKIAKVILSTLLFTSMSVPNIHTNRTAFYSSGNKAGHLDSEKAFDGVATTHWASNQSVRTNTLGITYPITKTFQGVKIFW